MTAPLRPPQIPEAVHDSMLLGGAERLRAVVAALGVPRRDWGLFSRWSEDGTDPRSLDLLGAYVDVMIAERCGKSTDDLVSDLMTIDVCGNELTADELRTIVVRLVTG